MDFNKLFKMIHELTQKKFYGTLEIVFKNGRPYLGVCSEKVLFDSPGGDISPVKGELSDLKAAK